MRWSVGSVGSLVALAAVGCGSPGGGGDSQGGGASAGGGVDNERPCTLSTTGAITVDGVACGNAFAQDAGNGQYLLNLAADGEVEPVTFQAVVTFSGAPEATTYQLSGFSEVAVAIADDDLSYTNLESGVMVLDLVDVASIKSGGYTTYLLHGELSGTLENELIGGSVEFSATF